MPKPLHLPNLGPLASLISPKHPNHQTRNRRTAKTGSRAVCEALAVPQEHGHAGKTAPSGTVDRPPTRPTALRCFRTHLVIAAPPPPPETCDFSLAPSSLAPVGGGAMPLPLPRNGISTPFPLTETQPANSRRKPTRRPLFARRTGNKNTREASVPSPTPGSADRARRNL